MNQFVGFHTMTRAILAIFMIFVSSVPPARGDDDPFFLSYWAGPPIEDARYAEIREANFTVASPGGGSSPEANRAILDLCRKHDLKALIYDSRINGADPAAPDFAARIDAAVADYAGHPALYGYHLIDEPGAAEFPRLAAIVARLKEKDPGRLAYINLFPNYATAGQLGNPSYEEHVDAFCKTVKPEILSYDHYALLDPAQPPRPEVFPNLDVVRRKGLEYGIPFCAVVLSTPHGPYRNPSEADLRWQAWTALAYGAKGISWFTYWTPKSQEWNFHNGILDETGKRTEHYEQVKRLHGAIRAMGPTLRTLTSTAVYAAGTKLPGVEPWPEAGAAPVARVEGGPFLVGFFVDYAGTAHATIVNVDFRAPATAKLTLSDKPRGLRAERFDPATSAWTPWPEGGVPIAPGDGVLLRISAP